MQSAKRLLQRCLALVWDASRHFTFCCVLQPLLVCTASAVDACFDTELLTLLPQALVQLKRPVVSCFAPFWLGTASLLLGLAPSGKLWQKQHTAFNNQGMAGTQVPLAGSCTAATHCFGKFMSVNAQKRTGLELQAPV